MLAGLHPDTTPIDQWCDASWAVLAEWLGSGEHIPDTWAEITGEAVPGAATADDFAGARPGQHGVDHAAASEAAQLSDDDLEAWVPAFSDDSITDEQFRTFWAHTAQFAAGQSALAAFAVTADKPRTDESGG